jgi:hypothetical protein
MVIKIETVWRNIILRDYFTRIRGFKRFQDFFDLSVIKTNPEIF